MVYCFKIENSVTIDCELILHHANSELRLLYFYKCVVLWSMSTDVLDQHIDIFIKYEGHVDEDAVKSKHSDIAIVLS